MIAMQEIEAITKQVLEKITPAKEDRAKVDAITRELEQKVALACKQEGIPAVVRVEGSVAKDTWLKRKPRHRHFHAPTNIDTQRKPRRHRLKNC